MQTIEALRLFKCNAVFQNVTLDSTDEINIDFKNVANIELADIKALLDVQKVALLNNKKVNIENVAPEVKQILEITGLYKTFSNLMTNPIYIPKRLSW